MPPTLTLPRADGTLAAYTLSGQPPVTAPAGPITSRVGMAAVHVVADPARPATRRSTSRSTGTPRSRYRRYL